MTSTYTIDRGDAVSRVRFSIGDTDMASPRFSDAEVEAALRETATNDFLQVYLDEDEPGVDGATVRVLIGGGAVELVLQRETDPEEEADTFSLSNTRETDKMTDLIDAVHALDKGWQLSFATRAEGAIIDVDRFFWNDPRYRVALGRATADLEQTPGALDVFGYDNAKRLSIWNLDAAAQRLRRRQALDPNEFQSVREGNVSYTRADPQKTLAAGGMPYAVGVFTRIP